MCSFAMRSWLQCALGFPFNWQVQTCQLLILLRFLDESDVFTYVVDYFACFHNIRTYINGEEVIRESDPTFPAEPLVVGCF